MRRFKQLIWQTASAILVCIVGAHAQSANTPAPAVQNSAATGKMTLDERVRAEVAGFKGNIHLFAKNLDTGAIYALDADERVQTASTIKVAIMVEAFTRVSEGKAKWDDELVLTKEKKVGGSGILFEFHDGLHLTLRDAVNLMMVLSDNTATNLVIDALGIETVNARMDALGFKQTRVLRKVFHGDESASQAGRDPRNKVYGLGMTTPHEMVSLLEKVERGEVVNPTISKEMIDLLKREQRHDGVGRTLEGKVEMALKSGALDHLRSDVGILYTKRGRIALAITCDQMPEVDWTDDNPAYLLMSRLTLILMDGLGK